MPDERAYDREAGALDHLLDRVGDIADAISVLALRDACVQRLLGGGEQAVHLRLNVLDRERSRGVGNPAVERDTDVDGDAVAALETVGAGNAVHDHRVGRGADRTGKATVTLERGDGAARADEALGELVELCGADAWTNLALDLIEGGGKDQPGLRHLVDLLRRLLDDHPRSLARRVGRGGRAR